MKRLLAPVFVLLAVGTAFAARAAPVLQPTDPTPQQAGHVGHYFPPPGQWERRDPAQSGLNAEKLAGAIEWVKQRPADIPADFSTQSTIFGRPLGPLPTRHAGSNGVIIRHGYIAAEWGDTAAVDPAYSCAKSYLSTLLGLAIDRGVIPGIDDPVGKLIHDGGYDSPQNATITWRHHVTQTSEWQGEMFGKSHTFQGKEEFGQGAMRPRELQPPGTRYEYNDVRINRFSLSLMRAFNRPLPDVLRTEIMDPIGASATWVYHGYANSTVDVDGTPMVSVSGGTRWGGGLWMNSLDHARFGYLMLRRGEWNGRRIISEEWIKEATSPQGVRKDYGYLWWLNTDHAAWPGAPVSAFAAQGAGSNVIYIDPENDLVVVWRWHARGDQAEFFARLTDAVEAGSPPAAK
ncbi:MAG: hypothetical protein AMXMBFR58_22470 [Phycisphaerae bacterium]